MAFDLGGIGGALGFGGGTPGDVLAAALGAFTPETTQQPLLRPVKPPRRQRRRPTDPFDFFGTLFTQPATQGLIRGVPANASNQSPQVPLTGIF